MLGVLSCVVCWLQVSSWLRRRRPRADRGRSADPARLVPRAGAACLPTIWQGVYVGGQAGYRPRVQQHDGFAGVQLRESARRDRRPCSCSASTHRAPRASAALSATMPSTKTSCSASKATTCTVRCQVGRSATDQNVTDLDAGPIAGLTSDVTLAGRTLDSVKDLGCRSRAAAVTRWAIFLPYPFAGLGLGRADTVAHCHRRRSLHR